MNEVAILRKIIDIAARRLMEIQGLPPKLMDDLLCYPTERDRGCRHELLTWRERTGHVLDHAIKNVQRGRIS